MQATWFVLEKNAFTMEFAREYLRYTLDERIASYQNDRVCGLPDLPGFVENWGDQSVLSCLRTNTDFAPFAAPVARLIGSLATSFAGIRSGAGAICCCTAAGGSWPSKLGNLRHKIRQNQIC